MVTVVTRQDDIMPAGPPPRARRFAREARAALALGRRTPAPPAPAGDTTPAGAGSPVQPLVRRAAQTLRDRRQVARRSRRFDGR